MLYNGRGGGRHYDALGPVIAEGEGRRARATAFLAGHLTAIALYRAVRGKAILEVNNACDVVKAAITSPEA
jgi:hypothetical protein